jgi:hypothetical protein
MGMMLLTFRSWNTCVYLSLPMSMKLTICANGPLGVWKTILIYCRLHLMTYSRHGRKWYLKHSITPVEHANYKTLICSVISRCHTHATYV